MTGSTAGAASAASGMARRPPASRRGLGRGVLGRRLGLSGLRHGRRSLGAAASPRPQVRAQPRRIGRPPRPGLGRVSDAVSTGSALSLARVGSRSGATAVADRSAGRRRPREGLAGFDGSQGTRPPGLRQARRRLRPASPPRATAPVAGSRGRRLRRQEPAARAPGAGNERHGDGRARGGGRGRSRAISGSSRNPPRAADEGRHRDGGDEAVAVRGAGRRLARRHPGPIGVAGRMRSASRSRMSTRTARPPQTRKPAAR